MRTALAAIALPVRATLAGIGRAVADPDDGLDPNRLACQLWEPGVASSAIYDRLVQQFRPGSLGDVLGSLTDRSRAGLVEGRRDL